MDPRGVLKKAPRPVTKLVEESPATHLAKLRRMKKNPTKFTQSYENAVNNIWRGKYVTLFKKERG